MFYRHLKFPITAKFIFLSVVLHSVSKFLDHASLIKKNLSIPSKKKKMYHLWFLNNFLVAWICKKNQKNKKTNKKNILLPLLPKFNLFKIPKLHPDVQIGIHPISSSPSALPSAVPDNLVDATPNYVLNLDLLFVYRALGKVFIMYNSLQVVPPFIHLSCRKFSSLTWHRIQFSNT